MRSNLSINSYRKQIETTFEVPNDLYFNRQFFILIMNSYLNLVSFFTIILNLGRVNEYKLYYLINVITSCLIGTVDYLQYQDCNYNCTNLLSNNNYYKTDILIQFLPYLQFLISLNF